MSSKTPLQYLKEITEVTTKSFEIAEVDSTNMFERGDYVVGDGDVLQPVRPGGLDFLKCPSRGLLTGYPSS